MRVSPVVPWVACVLASLAGVSISAQLPSGCDVPGRLDAGALLEPRDGGLRRWPVPPFDAVVRRSDPVRRGDPDAGQRTTGLLARGASVRVLACRPDCEAKGAWAELEGVGWSPLSGLMLSEAEDGGAFEPEPEVFAYGVVQRRRISVFPSPDAGTKPLVRLSAPRTLALYPDVPDGGGGGFYRRAAGGYVRAGDVRLDRPSAFAGMADPPEGVAFVRRRVELTTLEGKRFKPRRWAKRQQALELLDVTRSRVATAEGAVPRDSVRIALRRERPKRVPDGAKWVHVDLEEQVLTAYEGDRLVYATLVSTGADDDERQTHEGLHRVWYKSRHDRMRGEDYHLEEVPYAMYFFRSEALHGTFWHDSFGTPRTHGCVNLSLTDAHWLFDWAPPAMAAAFHSLSPGNAGLDSLWVQVERARAPDEVWSRRPMSVGTDAGVE